MAVGRAGDHESGWRFQVHTTRNHSAEQLLPAIEEINREIPVHSRRLSFAHMEDVTPETMRRIKALGGGVTVQDRFVYSGGEVAHNWPEDIVPEGAADEDDARHGASCRRRNGLNSRGPVQSVRLDLVDGDRENRGGARGPWAPRKPDPAPGAANLHD